MLKEIEKRIDELTEYAYYDALTGLLNRRAVEKKITETMSEKGILLVGDLDNFKSINDKYGHLEGDECLKKAANMLKYMIRDNDVLGRIGGDEFVLFFKGDFEEDKIDFFIKRIENRFRSSNKVPHSGLRLSITLAGTLYQEGDTYESLFNRADQILIRLKQAKRTNLTHEVTQDNWETDILQIRQDLIEQISIPGAYCQDYESFKIIYRFLERSMVRQNRKITVILFSIVDEKGQSTNYLSKDKDMDRLGEILQNTLRLGDVYARYSSNQYLVIAIDASIEDANKAISNRIQSKFNAEKEKEHILVHYCYELHSTKIKNKIK